MFGELQVERGYRFKVVEKRDDYNDFSKIVIVTHTEDEKKSLKLNIKYNSVYK